MSKRTRVMTGLFVYGIVVALPFLALVALGFYSAIVANQNDLYHTRVAHDAWSSGVTTLRLLMFFDSILLAMLVSAGVMVVAGVPLAIYLAVVHMLDNNTVSMPTPPPPPIQNYQP